MGQQGSSLQCRCFQFVCQMAMPASGGQIGSIILVLIQNSHELQTIQSYFVIIY